MGTETVRITFPSGVEIFGTVAEVQAGAGYSKPRLLSISNVYRAINREKAFENSSIEVVLNDTDGYFAAKMVGSDQYIKGKTLAYYDGTDLIFSGKISKIPECALDEFRVVADIQQAGLTTPLNSVITKSEYANVPADNEGKWGNIIAGTADDTGGNGTGMCTALRVNTGIFLAAWHHLHSLISVFDSTGTDITSSCTLDNNADGNAYINYASADMDIYFSSTGFEVAGVFTENPATILNKLIELFGTFTIDGITAAETIYTGRAYTGISIVISDDMTWAEFIQKFSHDWDAMIFMQADGHLKIKVLEWGSEIPTVSIPAIYIHEYKNSKDIEKIINQYKRMYWYHFRKNFFHRLPQDVGDTTPWEATSEPLDLRFHSDDATSKDIASGILYFMKNPAIYYRIRVESSISKTIELGDAIYITYAGGYYPNEDRMMQVFRKEKAAGDDCYFLTGIDISEINEGLILLYNDDDQEVYLLLDEATDTDCGVLL